MNTSIPPEFIGAGLWLWENIGKEFIKEMLLNISNDATDAVKDFSQKQWDKVEWSIASKKYRDRMYDLYHTMRMLGNPNPVAIDRIYTDVYILDKPSAYLRYDIDSFQNKNVPVLSELNSQPKVNALDLIQEQKRLFILGKPGAGKTTLMKYLTILATKGEIKKIPIFVSLHDWAQSGKELIDFIVEQFDICSFPDAKPFIESGLLTKGRAILLFDGLDEVNEENDSRKKITRSITNFVNKFSENQYLITCRVAATDYSFEQFPYVEIADFSNEQINNFAMRWFNDQPDKGEQFIKELFSSQHTGFRELAQTPILLNLLCLSFDTTLSFPFRKIELYHEAIDALLKKWDSSRNIKRDEIYHGLSSIRRQQLLSRLAAEYFQRNMILFREVDITTRIHSFINTLPDINSLRPDGAIILKSIEAQHGILVERANRIHSFSHLTIQEYFTARYIAENLSDELINYLANYCGEDRWNEVLVMTAELLSSADNYFDIWKRAFRNLMLKNRTWDFAKPTFDSFSLLSPSNRLLVVWVSCCYDLTEISNLIEILINLLSFIDSRPYQEIISMLSQVDRYFRLENIFNNRQRNIGDYFDTLIELFDMKNSIVEIAEDMDNVFEKIELIKHTLSVTTDLINQHMATAFEEEIKAECISKIKDSLTSLHNSITNIVALVGFPIFNPNFPSRHINQIDNFGDYLYMTNTLIKCWNVAALTNRNAILNSLFLRYIEQ